MLFVQSWKKEPDTFGYWYLAPSLKDWDLGYITTVQKVENTNETYYEYKSRYNEIMRKVKPDTGFWFGPFQIKKPYEPI